GCTAESIGEGFPEDRRGRRGVRLPYATARGGDEEDVGIHRVREDLADAARVDLAILDAVDREVGPRGPQAHERAAGGCRERIGARTAAALTDGVPVALHPRRVQDARAAGNIIAV